MTTEQVIAVRPSSEAPGASSGSVLPQAQGAEGAPQTPRQPEGPSGKPKQYEFVVGGEEKEISLDDSTKARVSRLLLNRLESSKSLAENREQLTTLDQLLLKLGPKAIEGIKKGEFTRNDLALAHTILQIELSQKATAVKKLVKDEKIVTPKTERGGFLWSKKRTTYTTTLKTQLEERSERLTSDYIKNIRYDQMSPEKIEKDLIDLNDLRHSLERQMFGMVTENPLFDEISKGTSSGIRINNYVWDALTIQHPEETLLELSIRDPIAALHAFNQALTEGFTRFTGQEGKNLLKSEKPEIDSNVIKSNADKLKQEPNPEEIDPVTNENIKTAQAKLDAVNRELEEVKKEIGELETSEDYKTGELSEDTNKRLEFLEKRKDEVLKNKLLTKTDLELFQLTLKEAFDKALQKHNTPEEIMDRQEKAKAFDKWVMVADPNNYKKIIDAHFSQTFEDQFTLERLASIDEKDGEIAGAERIREHIFWLIDKTGYDQKLARKMLSDETIARAIIWVYKIDPKTVTDPEGNISIKLALPYLRSSQFQTGDLLRFMIHEGLKSAERGNSYLTLDEYYTKPKPELQLEAESIYREGVGRVEVNGQGQWIWEGDIYDAKLTKDDPATGNIIDINPALSKLRYKLEQTFANDTILSNINILTNRNFISSLPTTWPVHIGETPDALKGFYDQATNKLKVDSIPSDQWITIREDVAAATAENFLDVLDNRVGGEVRSSMLVATADYMLQKDPQERLKIARGIVPIVQVNAVNHTEDGIPHNYKIELDNNGNFFITDLANPDNPYELKQFFKMRLESFKNKKDIVALTPTQREDLRKEFSTILSELGLKILESQQIR